MTTTKVTLLSGILLMAPAVPHAFARSAAPITVEMASFGLQSDGSDATPAVMAALEKARAHKSAKLVFAPGRYDFREYDDYVADFSAEFHDIRNDVRFGRCLDPDSYVASQRLSEHLLERGSLGVVYPSVRRPSGTCVACFRPALVTNVRKASTYRMRWSGTPEPLVHEIR